MLNPMTSAFYSDFYETPERNTFITASIITLKDSSPKVPTWDLIMLLLAVNNFPGRA